ncbi:MAG: flagellar export protein FliJ [bacterium]|nr:flagellar export protein FliJ [bacterium]
MPRFSFKLQRVLDIKERKEEQLKGELANVKREYEEEEEILHSLERSHSIYLDRLRRHQLNTISIQEVRWYQTYLSKLVNDISSQSQKLEDLLRRIDELKEKLIEVSKERRVLEKLKERKWDEFKHEVEYLEQETLDEIGTSRHIRGEGSFRL